MSQAFLGWQSDGQLSLCHLAMFLTLEARFRFVKPLFAIVYLGVCPASGTP
jgi:hypothetical protein